VIVAVGVVPAAPRYPRGDRATPSCVPTHGAARPGANASERLVGDPCPRAVAELGPGA